MALSYFDVLNMLSEGNSIDHIETRLHGDTVAVRYTQAQLTFEKMTGEVGVNWLSSLPNLLPLYFEEYEKLYNTSHVFVILKGFDCFLGAKTESSLESRIREWVTSCVRNGVSLKRRDYNLLIPYFWINGIVNAILEGRVEIVSARYNTGKTGEYTYIHKAVLTE